MPTRNSANSRMGGRRKSIYDIAVQRRGILNALDRRDAQTTADLNNGKINWQQWQKRIEESEKRRNQVERASRRYGKNIVKSRGVSMAYVNSNAGQSENYVPVPQSVYMGLANG